jgi:hypothetical protein
MSAHAASNTGELVRSIARKIRASNRPAAAERASQLPATIAIHPQAGITH